MQTFPLYGILIVFNSSVYFGLVCIVFHSVNVFLLFHCRGRRLAKEASETPAQILPVHMVYYYCSSNCGVCL